MATQTDNVIGAVAQVMVLGLMVAVGMNVVKAAQVGPSELWAMPMRKTEKKLINALKSAVLREISWAEDVYGKNFRGNWKRPEWGVVDNGMITLFHGTDRTQVEQILRDGLKAGAFTDTWDIGEDGEVAEMEYGVSLAVTPYYAFFYGNACLAVEIPASWITDFHPGDDEIKVTRDIPPGMIVGTKSIEDFGARR